MRLTNAFLLYGSRNHDHPVTTSEALPLIFTMKLFTSTDIFRYFLRGQRRTGICLSNKRAWIYSAFDVKDGFALPFSKNFSLKVVL